MISSMCMFFRSVKPSSEHIRYISRWRNIKSEVNYSPNKMSKGTSKKEMVNRLLLAWNIFSYNHSNYISWGYPLLSLSIYSNHVHVHLSCLYLSHGQTGMFLSSVSACSVPTGWLLSIHCPIDRYIGFQFPRASLSSSYYVYYCWLPSQFLNLMIRLKRIYNFWCSMLVFTPFALCFVTLCGVFIRFPELTYWQDATVPVPCFLLFLCFRKATQEIFS
jgi:hypothetical protein